jgi:hypothetical protein
MGEQRKSDFGAVMSPFDPTRTSASRACSTLDNSFASTGPGQETARTIPLANIRLGTKKPRTMPGL